MPGSRYTLEVSSPGLERPLRTPEQFARAVGEQVMVRTLPDSGLERRVRGTLAGVNGDAMFVTGDELPDGGMRIAYADVERARTVFEWGPSPRPGPSAKPTSRSTQPARKGRPTSKKPASEKTVAS
jgi:ribosome maturation factor RimP